MADLGDAQCAGRRCRRIAAGCLWRTRCSSSLRWSPLAVCCGRRSRWARSAKAGCTRIRPRPAEVPGRLPQEDQDDDVARPRLRCGGHRLRWSKTGPADRSSSSLAPPSARRLRHRLDLLRALEQIPDTEPATAPRMMTEGKRRGLSHSRGAGRSGADRSGRGPGPCPNRGGLLGAGVSSSLSSSCCCSR